MRVVNKQARRNYQIMDTFEAGVMLTGAEAKAAREGRVDLTRSYAKLIKGEPFLINAAIYVQNVDPGGTRRTRKLLLRKGQIVGLGSKMGGKGMALVPIALYTKKNLVKIEIGVGKSKREFDKRRELKKRDIDRSIEKELKMV